MFRALYFYRTLCFVVDGSVDFSTKRSEYLEAKLSEGAKKTTRTVASKKQKPKEKNFKQIEQTARGDTNWSKPHKKEPR